MAQVPQPHIDLEYIKALRSKLLESSKSGVESLKDVLPAEELCLLLERAASVLKPEPTLLTLEVADPEAEVVIVGDTHGQLHDVCNMLDVAGYPCSKRLYVFNGDFVDRGAWGIEVLTLFLALKLALPNHVFLLRGNHESTTCTRWYGFRGELDAKYKKQAKAVYAACKKVFCNLPLAALIQGNTLVLHGGLFRKPPPPIKKGGGKKRRRCQTPVTGPLQLGTLDDLRTCNKGGMDPDGSGTSVVAADVLWSDPVGAEGLETNDARGVGLIFGPNVTNEFLLANKLKLIIRSHEGPDARDLRSDLPSVMVGHSDDHTTPAGKLITLFSAPDYPQFQEDDDRYNNLGAVAVLTAPDYATPVYKTFSAVERPPATAFYDYMAYALSDDEVPSGDVSEAECSAGGKTSTTGASSAAADSSQSGDGQDAPGTAQAEAEVSSAAVLKEQEGQEGPEQPQPLQQEPLPQASPSGQPSLSGINQHPNAGGAPQAEPTQEPSAEVPGPSTSTGLEPGAPDPAAAAAPSEAQQVSDLACMLQPSMSDLPRDEPRVALGKQAKRRRMSGNHSPLGVNNHPQPLHV